MRTLLLISFVLTSLVAKSQSQHRFQVGEKLTYAISYQLMGVWVGAGEVTFSVNEDKFLGHDCFEFRGFGKTYPRYNWFFEVEDLHTSYADKRDLRPYRFFRDVSEGGFYFREENLFDYRKQRVYSVLKVKERPLEVDTHALDTGSFDVLSLIYHSRNLDFDSYKKGEKIPIKMFIDREVNNLYIRYLGIDTFEHSKLGNIECHLFSPLLVKGTIFQEGEGMKVWVTRDKNVIPIYIESKIKVGTIRSELISFEGLKYKLGSRD